MLRFKFASAVHAIFIASACLSLMACSNEADSRQDLDNVSGPGVCAGFVKADIVALEQAYILNRYSAYVPAGMLFALRSDVVALDGGSELKPGQVKLRSDKRPRPLVLRVNKGDCLDVTFTNLLSPTVDEEGGAPPDHGGRLPEHVNALPGSGRNELSSPQKVSVDRPRTRAASFHITGLSVAPISAAACPKDAACGGDGTDVGLQGKQGMVFNAATSDDVKGQYDIGSLAKPGQTVKSRWLATDEGAFFAYSAAAPVGGEGDGGQIGLGLFGAVHVEPQGSRWYRSQVTHDELQLVRDDASDGHHRYSRLDYERKRTLGAKAQPILAILDADNNIVHSDINAIVVPREGSDPDCKTNTHDHDCDSPFREFTVIFHDEVHAEQAFPELADENNPLHQVRDGMGINYGVSSMGVAAMATPALRGNKPPIGPVAKCPECRAEEFFLTSWANGDPALVLSYDEKTGKPNGARYPDDPSNVHHSYLGDPVKFRNLHAGPKETHIFHLHAHQWFQDTANPGSSYLDSQTISPGATFSYGIAFGGSGNRNYTPGDSIFHCHLYPHFAQGMWELWRVHDAFRDGKPGLFKPEDSATDPSMMNLPDGEIATGTQTPAVVPLPGFALAPMPSAAFRGYPFYIAGEAGHRPPQPPLDIDVADESWNDAWAKDWRNAPAPKPETIVDGGLPRHIVVDGKVKANHEHALTKGGDAAQIIAQRVAKQDSQALALAFGWDKLTIHKLNQTGEPQEQAAMRFHQGRLDELHPVDAPSTYPDQWPGTRAYPTDVASLTPTQTKARPALFFVNSRAPKPGAPFADPCPTDDTPERNYRAAFIQTELTYNKHGWFDPQGRIVILENDIKNVIDPNTRTQLPEPLFFRANSRECINFKSSNFAPSALAVDDFQIYTPTDTIGQHIHLVKFDVTSSDGSGNGFNYEDSTFSPDEVRERIFAVNRTTKNPAEKLHPKVHPLFNDPKDPKNGGVSVIETGDIAADKKSARLLAKGQCPPQGSLSDEAYEHLLDKEHPYCGAQRTTQRWWADPIVNRRSGRDDTLRTVFTHDHMGPSSHQQHGLYAGLVIEPSNTLWTRLDLEPKQVGETVSSGKPLNCHLRGGDPSRSLICDKLIGGSDPHSPAAASIHEPLRIRGDGGPTATMANILTPACFSGADAYKSAACKEALDAHETRREFLLAVADFGIAYNMALEPINPEPRGDSSAMRDNSAIRFGRRHVAEALARPLGISSEDPGSQYFNYRHDPLALRLSDLTLNKQLGGWDYAQATKRSDLKTSCNLDNGDQDCLGDPANGMSTAVHAKRDEQLATTPSPIAVSPATRDLIKKTPVESKLAPVLSSVERWRRDFNCMLYPTTLMGKKEGCPDRLIRSRLEPWRRFGDPATPILPVYERDPVQIRLIQGAQEAQHVFTMNGLKWPRLPGGVPKTQSDGSVVLENNSGFVDAQALGISEHFEFDINVNQFGGAHTDYLYFGSSVDQLWDGLWGVMRSFTKRNETTNTLKTASAAPVTFTPASFLAPLRQDQVADRHGDMTDICPASPSRRDRYFDISAVRVCDLYNACDAKDTKGINYSTRFDLKDTQGVVYVLNAEGYCDGAANEKCDEHEANWFTQGNSAVMNQMRAEFTTRPIEPLVLRAAAGECLHVNLRNLLPAKMEDGPGPEGVVPDERAYYNFLPMITDGFNINQFRMSGSVGLSAPRVAQHVVSADGSNVGLNGAVSFQSINAKLAKGDWLNAKPDVLARQGSLIAPCVPGVREARCKRSFIWSATDFKVQNGKLVGKPIEFGALPLRSFGDPIKHPTHGLVGALIIGPEGSEVCKASDSVAPGKPTFPGGVSARICAPGREPYVDQVLVMQDAVSATSGGHPVPNLSGAEEPDDYGVKAINYKTEPLWARRGGDPSIGFPERNTQFDYSKALSSGRVGEHGPCVAGVAPTPALDNPCDPETPVIVAVAGDKLRLNIVHPGGHTRQQGFEFSGHSWNPYPWSDDSRVFDPAKGSSIRQGVYNGFGPMMGVTLQVDAGGAAKQPMDYLFRSEASFLFDGGLWGILRVEPKSASVQSRRGE